MNSSENSIMNPELLHMIKTGTGLNPEDFKVSKAESAGYL